MEHYNRHRNIVIFGFVAIIVAFLFWAPVVAAEDTLDPAFEGMKLVDTDGDVFAIEGGVFTTNGKPKEGARIISSSSVQFVGKREGRKVVTITIDFAEPIKKIKVETPRGVINKTEPVRLKK